MRVGVAHIRAEDTGEVSDIEDRRKRTDRNAVNPTDGLRRLDRRAGSQRTSAGPYRVQPSGAGRFLLVADASMPRQPERPHSLSRDALSAKKAPVASAPRTTNAC